MNERPPHIAEAKAINRILGLDSIRFVAALIVLLGHLPVVPSALYDTFESPVYRVFAAGLGVLFNGPAAVIVFFVVSGFCIHYPFRNGATLSVGEFYSRRAIRLGVPAIVAVALFGAMGVKLTYPLFGVLWSVICEAVYYALYPFLLRLRRYISWDRMAALCFLAAFLLCVVKLDEVRAASNSYVALGLLTWVVGLPCWILGCWLAENFQKFRVPATRQIVAVRLGILVASVALRVAKHHGGVAWSNVFTLNAFSIAVVVWLAWEIQRYMHRQPSRILEMFGTWSYSLYLIHTLVIAVASSLIVPHSGNSIPLRILIILLCFPVAYIFFRVVELPSQQFAGSVGRRMRRRSMRMHEDPAAKPTVFER